MISPVNFDIPQAYSDLGLMPSLAKLGKVAQQPSLQDLGARYSAGNQQSVDSSPMGAAAPVPNPSADQSGYAKAISGIESGGKYDALGPVTNSGDRAYGKYQIMGANIPEWTKAVFGRSMTPEQFLASPAAQDAVFKSKFGEYVDKYGATGAAKAWFAGEGGMKNPQAKDLYGTTVEDYARRFEKNLEGG